MPTDRRNASLPGISTGCRAVRETLSQLSDAWPLVVILRLSAGPLRSDALQRFDETR